MAFGHSSLRWFEAYSCKSASRGLPSSFVQLRAITDGKKTTHLFALVAHVAVSINRLALTVFRGIYLRFPNIQRYTSTGILECVSTF